MAVTNCLALISLLVLSVILGLCSAAPLDKVKEDSSKAIVDWPIRDTEQFEYNPLKGRPFVQSLEMCVLIFPSRAQFHCAASR